MTKRQFHDAKGLSWDVWDVRPSDATVRGYDRRGDSRDQARSERAPIEKPPLDPLLEDGWLCFQTGPKRRRFAPIPPAWMELPDAVLRVMLDIANPVAARTESSEIQSRPADASEAGDGAVT